jgi:5-methylcytosine-specific restriction endonuclease McrA
VIDDGRSTTTAERAVAIRVAATGGRRLSERTAADLMLKANQPIRIKGKKLEALRRACFERDMYCCAECCRNVTWNTGHMAHIKARGRGGSDTLDNVRALCQRCHVQEHSNGCGIKDMHY